MRHHATARAASRVLHVQHLVKQYIFHRARRNPRTIHPPIQQNLIWSGIVTAELPPPAPRAPSDMRALQPSLKVFGIQLIEKPVQIEMVSARVRRRQPDAPTAHLVHAAARAIGPRVLQIRLGERPGGFAPIHARK